MGVEAEYVTREEFEEFVSVVYRYLAGITGYIKNTYPIEQETAKKQAPRQPKKVRTTAS